ncbi:SdrD B-like domain-containing protein, partial [Chloroflexota bacterium]
ITNTGDAILEITGVNFIGTWDYAFSKVSDNASGQTLAPGESANVSVEFNPIDVGLQGASLRIGSNDPDENPKDVALSGSGITNAVIHCTVYDDANGNGVKDGGEVGIAGVIVTLDGTTTNTTDSNGYYSFNIATTGIHAVNETDPSGYFSTTPNVVTVDVILGNSYQVDFGDKNIIPGPNSAMIYGIVFEDANGDGAQDPGEAGIAGVTVTLDGTSSNVTNANGIYFLTTNTSGMHTVNETDPVGYFSTTPNVRTVNVTLGNSYQVDFGDKNIIPGPNSAMIYGIVFEDANGDGAQDPGEAGIPGVTVTLDGTSSNVTNTYGVYFLTTNTSGLHTVNETDPVGYSSTTPNVRTVDVTLGNSYQVDFGDTHGIPDISISPISVNFGSVLIGSPSTTGNVTVTNNGTANLSIGTITIDDPQFAISTGNISSQTITPGSSANISLVFTPSSDGAQSGTVTIPSNDPDVSTVNVTLTGTGTTPEQVDLQITKVDDPDPVAYGKDLVYTLTVTNNGTDTATDVNVTDMLSPYLIHKSHSTTTGSVNATSDNWSGFSMWSVEWDIGDLTAGASASLDIVTTLRPEILLTPLGGYSLDSINNTATVSCNELDTDPSNNTVSEETGIIGTDLEITKVDLKDPVGFTDNFTWIITVTNNGPLDAENVTVIEPYAANITKILSAVTSTGSVSDTMPQWLDDIVSGYNMTSIIPADSLDSLSSLGIAVKYWNIGDLASNASANLTLTSRLNINPSLISPVIDNFDGIIRVMSLVGGDLWNGLEFPLPNYAGVISPVIDTDASNNYAIETTSITVPPLPEADLEITKSGSPDIVASDGTITYTVTVKNNGPDDASGVFVIDVWPENMLLSPVVINTTQGAANQSHPDWLVNLLDLTNLTGLSGLTGLTGLSGLPSLPGFPGLPGLPDLTGLTDNASLDQLLDQLDVELLYWDVGDLANDESANLTFSVSVNATVAQQVPYVMNGAIVMGKVYDPASGIPSNNMAMVTTPVQDTFTLTYTAGPGGTISGNTTQIVKYGENGTEVKADPNEGYYFVKWSDNSTDNPRTDINVTADVNVTANFAPKTFTLNYSAGLGGYLTGNTSQTVNYGENGTSVEAVPNAGHHFVEWSDGSKANPRTDTNVIASVNVTANFILIHEDWQINKVDDPDPVLVNENLTYTITVRYIGPGDAENVTVTDLLPKGVSYQSSSTQTGNVSHSSGNITWNVGYLASGVSANLTILVTAPSVEGVITNHAFIDGERIIDDVLIPYLALTYANTKVTSDNTPPYTSDHNP